MEEDQGRWSQLSQDDVAGLKMVFLQRQTDAPREAITSFSRMQVPHVQKLEADIPQLKLHLIHIWVFIHNLDENKIKKTSDYKQFSKMYAKSKYMLSKFSVHIHKVSVVLAELKKDLDLIVNCYVYSSLITDQELWKQLRPNLQNDFIGEIIVKSGTSNTSKKQQQKSICQERFKNQFKYGQRYAGFVSNFDDALQLQKKILNLAMSKSKPNFFIINQYQTVQATQNLNSFHDILINTKAYLKESLDIKTKDMVLKAFHQFKSFIYEQMEEKEQCFKKYGLEKIKKKISVTQVEDQKKLHQFFSTAEDKLNKEYPFRNGLEEEFYENIIQVYTLETIVYQCVNLLCKSITSKQVFMKISFFCKFLNLAIKFKGKKLMSNLRSSKYKKLYRGAMMSDIELESLKSLIGRNGYIINLAFLSTSLSQRVAHEFYKKGRNNIIIEITINQLFWDAGENQLYSSYLEYFLPINHIGAGKTNEQEVLFNCYNVFKVLGLRKEDSKNILELEAFSHLQIIKKKVSGQSITQEEEKILDVIVRVEKGRDYAQQLKEQGKTVQMKDYLDKVVKSGIDLNVNQAEIYIQFLIQSNQKDAVQFIEKNQHKAKKGIQEEINYAIYESFKEQYLQSQIYLEKIAQQMKQYQSKMDTMRQSWSQLKEKITVQFAVAANKQKIGAYEDFFKIVDHQIQKIATDFQIAEFIENVQTWKKLYDFMVSSKLNEVYQYLEGTQQRFGQIYRALSVEKQKKDRESILKSNNLIKEFLSIDIQKNFFRCSFKLQNQSQFVLHQNQLRRDVQIYKNKFYQRTRLKVKILIHYYEILIKSEKKSILQAEEQKKSENLFTKYFENSRHYFKILYQIFKSEPNQKYKYQIAIFYKEYAKFLNGFTFYSGLNQEEKASQRILVQKLFQEARDLVAEVNEQHQEIVNIKNIQDNISEERIFIEKIKKRNSIYQSIHNIPNSQNSNIKEQELISFVENLRKSRFENAKVFKVQNSLLNQNLCYTSALDATIQVLERQITNPQLKRRYTIDFQKLANRIESNITQNDYLRKHTFNAFNSYLKASFEYYRGRYEASMVFLAKSEEILDEKLKSTISRIAVETNPQKKADLQNKLSTIKQNNQVRIKICILKSKICINYKPNIHSLCINNLTDQEKFIKQKLFDSNSALPEIYYYETYLNFLNNVKDHSILEKALHILVPDSRRKSRSYTTKRDLLKYYELLYYLGDRSDQEQAEEKIDNIAEFHKIAAQDVSDVRLDIIEEQEAYYLFKLQKYALNKGVSMTLLFQYCFNNLRNLSSKPRMDKLYDYLQKVKDFFGGQNLKYWEIIDKIICLKIKRNFLISHRLFLFHFVYLQFLSSQSIKNKNIQALYKKLLLVLHHLSVIVQDTEVIKSKYNIPQTNNSGFEDKVKIIKLHMLKFGSQSWVPPSSILPEESQETEELFQKDYKQFKERFFNDV